MERNYGIILLHLKYLNQKSVRQAHDAPWGRTGTGNISGVKYALKDQVFKGLFTVEHERNWKYTKEEVEESIDYFYRVANMLIRE